jgi:hypothetical protein
MLQQKHTQLKQTEGEAHEMAKRLALAHRPRPPGAVTRALASRSVSKRF